MLKWEIHTALWSADQIKMYSATVWNCVKSGCRKISCRHMVQLHWRLCKVTVCLGIALAKARVRHRDREISTHTFIVLWSMAHLSASVPLAPQRIWRWGRGHTSFLSCPSTFFGSTSTIGHFGERFRDGQYSLVSFLFAVLPLTVPPCPAICKSGAARAPCPMESAPVVCTSFSRMRKNCELLISYACVCVVVCKMPVSVRYTKYSIVQSSSSHTVFRTVNWRFSVCVLCDNVFTVTLLGPIHTDTNFPPLMQFGPDIRSELFARMRIHSDANNFGIVNVNDHCQSIRYSFIG